MGKNASDLLIELLEKVHDADKLETLLHEANLILLLNKYSREREEIVSEVENGKRPGELLLDLLNIEPDADKLISFLPA